MDELLAAFDGRAYVRLLTGGMAVVDIESGKIVENIFELLPRQLLVNSQTNRLYLVSETGAVQCLRPEGSDLPTISSALQSPEDKPAEAESKTEPAGPQPVMDPAADPFAPGAAADPFGAGNNDPFGDAAADPFGGGADAADPFGGADPFGN